MYSNRKKEQGHGGNHISQLHTASVVDEFPHRLNFYTKPPLYQVTIEEFESAALDRLRVLAEIESSLARNRTWLELKEMTDKHCKKYLNLDHYASVKAEVRRECHEQRKKDELSHFVLRLAFCRSEELRRRFVKAELILFKVRYETTNSDERKILLTSPRDSKGKIDMEVFDRNKFESDPSLKSLRPNLPEGPWLTYYKVKWTQVPDLVEARKVFVKGGFAYVPEQHQSSIIFQEFEKNLVKALEDTAKAFPRLDEENRLIPILDNLSQGFLAGVSTEWSSTPASGDEIRAEMVDDIAKKHFPMCMRNLHESLMRDRHLKHFGRLQYGLFLKVLGLSIEEAIMFWRKSFSSITDDKFNKEYKYNIRHSFGLEGKRANYPAKSCQQILTSDKPGPSDCHGCPYRHFAPENLQSALLSSYGSHGVTTGDLPEIMNHVKGGHYHVACTRVFEITHKSKGVKKGDGIGGGESVTHPNQYAARSRELYGSPGGDVEMTDSQTTES